MSRPVGTRTSRGFHARMESDIFYEPNTGCWLWGGPLNDKGYGSTTYLGRKDRAHRASYSEYIAPIPPGLFVLHKCDVPSCVNPNHLFVGTQIDNMQDCSRKRRNRPVLTPEQVRAIRAETRSYERAKADYRVSLSTFYNVKNRKLHGQVV